MSGILNIEKEKMQRETIEKNKEDYKNVIEIYNEYKRLRKALGKPERYPLDPQKIREDLSSEEFLKFLKEPKGKSFGANR